MADALNANEVVVGTANGAGLYIAPVGTALPTDTTADLPAAWKALGYTTEDGVGQMLDIETEDIMSWQELAPVRTVTKSRTLTLKFSMLQWNPTTLALFMGAPEPKPAADGSFTLDLRMSDRPTEHAMLIDIDDAGRKYRIGLYRTILSATDDLALQRGTSAPLGVTVKALSVNGDVYRLLAGPTSEKSPAKAS